MKNIFKILMVFILPLLLINACRDDADKNWTSPEATIHLYSTTLSSNTLYPSMANNSFRLAWDAPSGAAGNYTVQISTTPDFKTPLALGTATVNSYTTTIATLNTALLQAGYSPYTQTMLYIRVISGTNVSNVISLGVTPYPVAKPIITNPLAGSSLILDQANQSGIATTIKWSDYSTYGVTVNYLVEIAASGSSTFYPLGTVQNVKMLDVSNLLMDQTVLKTGAVANVASNIDIRVTASTTSAGGNIVKVSDIVTMKVTPYQLESFLYAPGAYQGWNPTTAEALRSATSNGVYIGYINFTDPNSEFKITTARNWDNSYGSAGGNSIVYNGGGNLVAPNTGYQKLTVNTTALTFSLEAYSWGVVGSATGSWDNDTDLTWNSTTQKWEIASIALSVGEIKFRLNNAWDTNFGDDGNNGTLEPGGANIPITEAGNYKITFDEENLVWTKTKL